MQSWIRDVQLAFERKINSLVKMNSRTVEKLTGTNNISNLATIHGIDQTYCLGKKNNTYHSERGF